MAIICPYKPNLSCKDCKHHRYDEDDERWVCFLKADIKELKETIKKEEGK